MTSHWGVLAIALAAYPTIATAQQSAEEVVRGYHVTVGMNQDRPLQGELLTVEGDSIWVLTDGTPVGVALADIEGVKIKKHGLGPTQAILWSVVGGAVTGGALTAACSSVDGTEGCGQVFVGAMLGWLLIGAISAATLGDVNVNFDAPISALELRRYARYPQGHPVVGITQLPGARVGLGIRFVF